MKVNRLVNVVYFTDNGKSVYERLVAGFENYVFEEKPAESSLEEFTANSFKYHLPLVFIGATGIAVRTIAPFVSDKLMDSPVIVIDELGINVIPVLSGHFGMANDLAREFAKAINANPVITTATDINNVFSIDSFAVKNGYRIVDKGSIKTISSMLLRNEKPAVAVEGDNIFVDGKLMLVRKSLVIGMGCKKGKSCEDLLSFLLESYSEKELRDKLYAIVSIDAKNKEEGLLKLAALLGTKFITFSANELEAVDGDFTESEFVKENVGVGNVSERAAVCLGASLIRKKEARDGMTKAIAVLEKGKSKWQEEFIL